MRRVVSIDLMKFIATLAIFNHLAQRFYGGYSVFATGGAIGCAIFFFCSGFVLTRGRLIRFDAWYKRRLMRLWPTCFIAAIIQELHGMRGGVLFALSGAGWFVSCVCLHYLLFYFFVKIVRIKCVYVASSIFAMFVWYFLFYDNDKIGVSIFGENYFKWLGYFLFFLFGHIISENVRGEGVTIGSDRGKWLLLVSSFIVFYGYLFLARESVLLSRWQIVIFIPLLIFVWALYKVGSTRIVEELMRVRLVNLTVLTVGGLSLEMYLCGGFASRLVPAGIPVVSWLLGFLSALVFAYFARAVGRFFAQTFIPNVTADGGYDWPAIFKIC